ncbi:tyrosine-type recombinase/integrase [Gluconobacter cerinus]|uniref:tyrosine-type recombinase/integrase n=1 Tax=Gluconobacter cerinus TaxID=38307 RepID=UPI001B8AFAF5|nr:tyrosine-type recombinase/integrase [Gluconobacter cerinus]MBS1035364.1 tyrosine-type recombinase/integrase [Gluconobacter cerinus]
MSLKIVKRHGTKRLYLSGTVGGQRVSESTGTADPQRAEEIRAKREAELWQESIYGKKAVVTFAHAVAAYLESEERSETTKFHLRRLLNHFGARRLIDIAQTELDEAYRKILRDGMEASPATKMRGVLTPLRAVLEFAAIRRWCDRPAFDTPRIPKARTTYLKPAQVKRLIDCAAPHLKPLLVFLIGTGVRMSEALDLEWKSVDLPHRQAVVWQKQGTERRIDLPPIVVQALSALPHRVGHVFRPVQIRRPSPGADPQRMIGERYHNNGRTSGGQIKSGWAAACRKAGLPGHYRVWTPNGQSAEHRTFVPEFTPHDLRHTWATWHYCLHHDILRLKDEGGWETIGMVTRYAKQMPASYRKEIEDWASDLNPVDKPNT